MRSNRPLSGWLLACVRYTAANAIKIRQRRLRHEKAAGEAFLARGGGACSSDPTEVLVWQEIAAELDDAVLQLSAGDRRVVLLKYFENRGMDEIARDLQCTQGAARVRLSRALEKLRGKLDRRGVSVGAFDAAALGAILTKHTIKQATCGLARAACDAALGTGATVATTHTIAKGAIQMMNWTKAKIAATVLATAMIATTGGVVGTNLASAQDQSAVKSQTNPTGNASIQGRIEKLVEAIGANDRNAFVADATETMKAAMTPQTIKSVHDQLKPHMDSGYTVSYLGELKKGEFNVYVAKISFKDGSDDDLVQMTLLNGKLAGFFVQ
jgi:RNA polymerase sigma factor (sigma-70 family)